MKLKIKKLKENAVIPDYAHEGDAGLDIYSVEEIIIPAGEREIISTGLGFEIEGGFVGLVWDKSGLAANSGIKTMAGVLDSGYRGELKIVLLNTGKEDYKIEKRQKIAQLLIQPIVRAEVEEVDELSDSERGENRFGSTGL